LIDFLTAIVILSPTHSIKIIRGQIYKRSYFEPGFGENLVSWAKSIPLKVRRFVLETLRRSGVARGHVGGMHPWAKALMAHQHILQ